MILFSSDKGNDSLALTLVLTEILFKSIGMYTVKEFLNDLKATVDHPPPSVHFYSVYVPPESPSLTHIANNGTGSPGSNQNFNALSFPNYMNRPGSGSVSPTPVFV